MIHLIEEIEIGIRMQSNDRYFYCSYIINISGGIKIGRVPLHIIDGIHPSEEDLTQIIKINNPNLGQMSLYDSINIMSCEEKSKEDLIAFTQMEPFRVFKK